MFDRTFVVNLTRREDRMTEFVENWQSTMAGYLPPPQRVPAIDGKLCPRPDHWKKQGGGAWGCFRSHLRLIESALNEDLGSILLLEDDARFDESSPQKYLDFVRSIPEDWDVAYLGGQHLKTWNCPEKVCDQVYIPYNVNRTHAWGISKKGLSKVYKHLTTRAWNPNHHIDHHLGIATQQRKFKVYCPARWIAYQGASQSNINGKRFDDREWLDAVDISEAIHRQFVAILGPHSSGSSCIAGIAHALGIHLGNKLQGYWDKEKGGFEAQGLAELCERAVPFPETEFKNKKEKRWADLRGWISSRLTEAYKRKVPAGGKYPQLCLFGPQLQNIMGDNLRIISCDRDLEISIKSLAGRCPKRQAHKLRAHQTWLYEERENLIRQLKPEQVLRISYDDTIVDPLNTGKKMLEFLPDLHPDVGWEDQVQALVLPSLKHYS